MKKIFYFLCTCFLPLSLFSYPFPYQPPKEITLLKGYDSIKHPVTTENKEAQDFFNQGLALFYTSNYDAAYWSFLKASTIDPNLAMAYWGMALALGPNQNQLIDMEREQKAYELIQKALQISQNATPIEKDYIKALSARYTNNKTPAYDKLNDAYFEEMKALSIKYPYDPDAATLYAESALNKNPLQQWTPTGEPLKGTWEIVDTLERTLKWTPDHLGANHYYIQAIEGSKYPERALLSALKLKSLTPNSGHMLHMPSHIYLRVGDYHTAAISNEEAIKQDKAYIQEYGISGNYPVPYLAQNIFFLSHAYALEGRYKDALNAANELKNFVEVHFTDFPQIEYYFLTPLFINLRFQKWKQVLEFKAPPEKMVTSTILWHFARAMAFSALNDPTQAEKEKTLFSNGLLKAPASLEYGSSKAQSVFSLAALQLDAKIAESKGDISKATELLSQAATLQDELNYNELSDWYFPIRENLGGLWLKSKMWKEAAFVFTSDLEKHPRKGKSLFGLWQALEHQNQKTEAFFIKQEFERAWKYSDTPLSINNM